MTEPPAPSVVLLPPFLRPRRCGDLVRVGCEQDGGYVVRESDLLGSRGLLSFGIGDDWSFEQQFAARARCPVVAYDASVNGDAFFHLFVRGALKLHRPGVALERWRRWRSYRSFFRPPHRHVMRHVGLPGRPPFMAARDAFADAPPGPLFVKCDIEGHEYRILDTLLDYEHLMTGLAIEFHSVDLLLPHLEAFIAATSLHLVHVHANNAGQRTESGFPVLLELTFSAGAVDDVGISDDDLPHAADRPNDPTKDELVLRFGPEAAAPTGGGRR